ncbi:MAG: hypothetical protein LH472_07405 [Pyrinomonadaceae bacterium]|nr:hypothetical protein [Pyrinomonadaceae bacterium]
MKYVIMKDDETGEAIKLGRFGGKPGYIDETYFPKSGWQQDNTLYSDLLDGLLEEISETEANRIIAAHFSREKQAA